MGHSVKEYTYDSSANPNQEFLVNFTMGFDDISQLSVRYSSDNFATSTAVASSNLSLSADKTKIIVSNSLVLADNVKVRVLRTVSVTALPVDFTVSGKLNRTALNQAFKLMMYINHQILDIENNER